SKGRKEPVSENETVVVAGALRLTVASGLAAKSSRILSPSRWRVGSHAWIASARSWSGPYRASTAARDPRLSGSSSRGWPGERNRTRSSGTKQTRVAPSTSLLTLKWRSTSQYWIVSALVLLWFVMTLVVNASRSVSVAKRMPTRRARRRPAASRSTLECIDSAACEVNWRAPSSAERVLPELLLEPPPPAAPTPPTRAPIAPPSTPPIPPATPQLDELA